ncbi:MAG: outer membrane beta-barrel protein [Prevotellaceae bacterium]|jgi:hypothetical protein|nr:outer membrane beta-barrel protein [Prevotellaceae bacterium]
MKKLILIFFITICCSTVYGQRLGFIGGYQLTNSYAIVGGKNVDFNQTAGSGFLVGGYFDWNIKKSYGIDVQVLYTMRTSKFNLHYLSDTTTIFRRYMFNFEIPLHLYVNIPLKKNWILSPYLGPALAIGLHGQDVAWQNVPDWQKPVDSKKSDLFEKDKGRLNRFELAGQIGLTVKYKNYGLRAGYSLGLTNLTQKNFDWTLSLPAAQNKYLFNGVFSVAFIYAFDLKQ